MKPATRDRLLALNRQFYATVAEPFHSTRRSWPKGNVQLLQTLSVGGSSASPLRVLDAGCGNGRFASILDTLETPVTYTGVDGNRRLLEFARTSAGELTNVGTAFVEADLSQIDWADAVDGTADGFDLVVCLSTLQHMPGEELRSQLVRSLAAVLAPGGELVISAWQFLASPRLASRRLPWASVGLADTDVEPGDALLPWKQGEYAIRYVHQIDMAEMHDLAEEACMDIRHAYFADGKEGNLNLYAIMEKSDPVSSAR